MVGGTEEDREDFETLPCSIIVKAVLPFYRARIAEKLQEEYDLSQVEISQLLNVSQPSVSNYLQSKRGKNLEKEKLKEVINNFVEDVIQILNENETANPNHFSHLLCEKLREKDLIPSCE